MILVSVFSLYNSPDDCLNLEERPVLLSEGFLNNGTGASDKLVKLLWENMCEELNEYCSVTHKQYIFEQDISPPTSAAGSRNYKAALVAGRWPWFCIKYNSLSLQPLVTKKRERHWDQRVVILERRAQDWRVGEMNTGREKWWEKGVRWQGSKTTGEEMPEVFVHFVLFLIWISPCNS